MTTPAAPAADSTPAIPTDPAAIATRDAELTALYESDPNRYQYEDGGRLAKEHLALRQAGQPKDAVVDADDAADDLADADADAIDLDAPAEGTEVAEAEASDAERVDTSAYVFEPAEGEEVTEVGQARIDAFAEFAAKNGLAPEAYQGAIDWYNDLVKQEQVRLGEADKTAKADLVAGLKGELGESYRSFRDEVDGTFRELPKELRTALRSARLPDGRLLLSMPEAVRMVHALGNRQSPVNTQPRDHTAMLQAELGEINEAMNRDVSELYRPWKNTGMTASDRKLQIMRSLDNPDPNPRQTRAKIEDEKRELVKLRDRDPDMFRFGDWRGSGRPASDRLAAILAGRA